MSERGRRWLQHPVAYGAVGAIILALLISAYFSLRPREAIRAELPSASAVLLPVPKDEGESGLVEETPAIEAYGPDDANLPETVEKTSHEETRSFPYSIKLDAFRTLEGAKRSLSFYAERGLSPYWVKVDLGDDGLWYRVYVGQFTDPEEAEQYRQNHQLKDSKVLKTQYANLIGVYTSRSELEDRVQALKNLGYCPYVLEEPAGHFRLYVGAFLTKEGVEKQQKDLRTDKVTSQVVDR